MSVSKSQIESLKLALRKLSLVSTSKVQMTQDLIKIVKINRIKRMTRKRTKKVTAFNERPWKTQSLKSHQKGLMKATSSISSTNFGYTCSFMSSALEFHSTEEIKAVLSSSGHSYTL